LLCSRSFGHDAVELQFTYNRDFGCSPAGLISKLLVHRGIPYSPAGTLVYLAYAIPLFGVLLYLSRRFLAARFTLQQWAPVLLVGVILLNPRIMEYDVLPLTLPIAIILWRTFTRVTNTTFAILILCALVATSNIIAVQTSDLWKVIEGTLLSVVFAAGCWNLITHSTHQHRASQPEPSSLSA
jgi:hypothetical protein